MQQSNSVGASHSIFLGCPFKIVNEDLLYRRLLLTSSESFTTVSLVRGTLLIFFAVTQHRVDGFYQKRVFVVCQ